MVNLELLNNPLISIIVPVFNTEKYIEKCIDSLLTQKYPNLEIIIVNDGSIDGSGEICNKYSELNSIIKVIHKENAGLGMARNTGLDNISGRYVTFVDSDDWVSPNLISDMYNEITVNNADFCKTGFKRVKHNGEVISIVQYDDKTYTGKDVSRSLLPRMIGSLPGLHDSLEMCVCGVLYDAEIIRQNNIRFPSERVLISEDLVFNIDYMQHSKCACISNKLNYYYRMNEKSLSRHYRSDRLVACVFFYKEMRKKLEKLKYNYESFLRLDHMFFIFIRMCISQEQVGVSKHSAGESMKNIKKICDNSIVKMTINEYPIKRLEFKQRLFLLLIKNKQTMLLYLLSNLGAI